MDRASGGAGVGWGRGDAPSPTRDAALALQSEPGPPASHPEAAAPGHQLGRIRRGPARPRQLDGVVHAGGGRGVEGEAAHSPGRAAALLRIGDHDGPDPACGVPPGAAPDRGADRLHPPPARPRPRRAGPLDAQPPGRDAGGGAAAPRARARAPAGGQHGTAAVRARRVAGGEAWHQAAPNLEKAPPRHGRRHRPDRRLGAHRQGRR